LYAYTHHYKLNLLSMLGKLHVL